MKKIKSTMDKVTKPENKNNKSELPPLKTGKTHNPPSKPNGSTNKDT
jgi:hypothetical protein